MSSPKTTACVFLNQDRIPQVEAGWQDLTDKQTTRIFKEIRIVRVNAAIGDADSHSMSTTGSSRSLPIIRWERWDVSHHDHVQRTDVNTHLERWRGNKTVHSAIRVFEGTLDDFSLFRRYLSRVFFRRENHKALLLATIGRSYLRRALPARPFPCNCARCRCFCGPWRGQTCRQVSQRYRWS